MAIGNQFDIVLEQATEGIEQGWAALYADLSRRQLAYLTGRGTPEPHHVIRVVFADLARDLRAEPPADELALRMRTFSRTRDAATAAEESGGDSVEVTGAAGALLDSIGFAARDVLLLRIFGGFSAPDTAALLGFENEAVEDLQQHGLAELNTGMLAWATTQPRREVQDILDHAADEALPPTSEEIDRLMFSQLNAGDAHLAPYAIAIDHLHRHDG